MPTPYQEVADVTSVLRNILDNYPAGGAVLRELLQNSDDSGATTQVFRLDMRSHNVEGLHNAAIERCQGPALLAINNSTFSDKDWNALAQINNSSKSADDTTTGKYGLGFRSCYHVTDNPEVYSKRSLRILDPHKEFPDPYAGGMNLDSINDFEEYRGVFATFSPYFSPDGDYNGTVIRLPLRSSDQAERSRIKNGSDAHVTPEAIQKWFRHFIDTELSVVLLYLKHITSIKLEIVTSDSKTHRMAQTSILTPYPSGLIETRRSNRGHTFESSHYILNIETSINDSPQVQKWMVAQYVDGYEEVATSLVDILQSEFGQVVQQMKKDKLLPHVALAMPLPPCRDDFRGKLFSLLPLPIITDFPLHIHAIFALLSSRQHLRNHQEEVAHNSRERFLVEWNKLNFDRIIPRAWSYLIENLRLVDSSIDIYSAWPQVNYPQSAQGDPAYWANLPSRLLTVLASLQVWPDTQGRLRVLNDVLVASDESKELVQTLESAGAVIIRPPAHIFNLIKSSTFRGRILSPSTACDSLETDVRITQLNPARVDIIATYMASANDIALFERLPLLRNVTGTFVKLPSGGAILASKEEANLFATMNPNMLRLDLMPDTVGDLITRSPKNTRLDPRTVLTYLTSYETQNPLPDAGKVGWLCEFWEFLWLWEEGLVLLRMIQSHFMLPIRSGGLQEVSGRALDVADIDDAVLLTDLGRLGIPLLSDQMGKFAREFLRDQEVTALSSDIPFILDKAQLNNPRFWLLSPSTIFDHFKRHLGWTRLTQNQIRTLRQLPIFPILEEGLKRDSSTFAPAGQSCHFLDSSAQVVPTLRGITFIDKKACQELVRPLQLARDFDVKDELEVLQLVLLHPTQWSNQPTEVRRLLLNRLLSRFDDLFLNAQDQFRKLPFINVGGGEYHSPSEVVDPASNIARLFSATDRVLPVDDVYTTLPRLQAKKLLQHELSTDMIQERISNVHRLPPLTLLKVIDDYFLIHFIIPTIPTSFLPLEFFSEAWLTSSEGNRLVTGCRDRRRLDDLLLYDLAMPLIDYEVRSSELRERMGWDGTSTAVVLQQMERAVQSNDENKHRRICRVIKELADRFHEQSCTLEELDGLRVFLEGRAWVPVSETEYERPEQVTIDSVDLGPVSGFKQLLVGLRENDSVVVFLQQFGVPRTPSTEALIAHLAGLESREADEQALLNTTISFLTRLSNDATLTTEQRSALQVPIGSAPNRPLTYRPSIEVCYNDLPSTWSAPPPNMSFAHPTISSQLANKLQLQYRSHIAFQDVESEAFDAFDVKEDLTTRIKNVLKAYPIESCSNEWVANAADAGASRVAFVCNDQTIQINEAPSSALAKHFEGPSLIVYNSAKFSTSDFEGLRHVGIGGKAEQHDSIGRFGLGALSFYHFGDVIMLVSGDTVIFIDPTGENLPRCSPVPGEDRRTGMKLSLGVCQTLYPDFLRPLYGIEGFSNGLTDFDGTLFLVPLRTGEQASRSRISNVAVTVSRTTGLLEGGFFKNAKQSLFFTQIESIQAKYRGPNSEDRSLWVVSATREDHVESGESSHQKMTVAVTRQREKKSPWFITTRDAELPPEFSSLCAEHRLSARVTAALAVRLPTQLGMPVRSAFLFATLPLPLKNNLNMHIHAPWILSDSRRNIHLDSSSQRDPGLDVRFNKWLLSRLIPRLLLYTIATLNVEGTDNEITRALWPNEISYSSSADRLLVEGFYELLPSSNELVFCAEAGGPISAVDAIVGLSRNSSVYSLLGRSFPDRFTIPPFYLSSLSSAPAFNHTDSPAQVRLALLTPVAQLPNPTEANHLGHDQLVRHLLEGQESLVDLPLLQLQDGSLVCFEGPDAPPVFPFNHAVVSLFGGKHAVIREGFGRLEWDTVDRIVKLGTTNLRPLDVESLKDLLKRTSRFSRPIWSHKNAEEAQKWATEFWRCFYRGDFEMEPTIETLAVLEDLPLLPILGGKFITLSSCRTQTTFWRQPSHVSETTRQVLEVLVKLQGRVIDMDLYLLSSAFRDHVKAHLAVKIELVLDCLATLDPDAKGVLNLPSASRKPLATWIKSKVDATNLPTLCNTHPIIRKLPLWEAQQPKSASRSLRLKPLEEILMLPERTVLADVSLYLAGSHWFTNYNPLFTPILSQENILDPEKLLQMLNLPHHLDEEQIPPYLRLLRLLRELKAPIANQRLIPNEELKLCSPAELFNQAKIPLYALAFQYQKARLVRTEFLELMPWFETMGVNPNLTADGFLSAVGAIDEFVRSGLESESDVDLSVAFNMLNEGLWLFQRNSRDAIFQKIRRCRFIQKSTSQRLDPGLTHIGKRHGAILAPDQLVREEYQLVAWTQRAQFAVEPSEDLQVIFPQFGVPSAEEVVVHLTVLASAVRKNSVIGRHHIKDVKATYGWLDEHSDEASPYLLKARHEQIFWNVDDGSEDMSVWHSVKQMWRNLQYDDDVRKVYSTKGLLSRFPNFLNAANVPICPAIEAAQNEPFHSQFLQQSGIESFTLRERGLWTDVVLKARDGDVLNAHRLVLASSSPHFMHIFTGEFLEGSDISMSSHPLTINIPDHSHAEVSSVLHYVYTGEFTPPHPDVDNSNHAQALGTLLDLLNLCNRWNLGGLKHETGSSIITSGLVTPYTVDHVIERCKAAEAYDLLEKCGQFKEKITRDGWSFNADADEDEEDEDEDEDEDGSDMSTECNAII